MTGARLRTVVGGLVPGVLIGTGGGILLGLVAVFPRRIAAFFLGVGALVVVVAGLAYVSSESVGDSIGRYAGDDDFTVEDARYNALRLAGLGAGLAVGGAVTWAFFLG